MYLFPSVVQDRENLIHKISILLQAEIHRPALFFKDYKDKTILLRLEKQKDI